MSTIQDDIALYHENKREAIYESVGITSPMHRRVLFIGDIHFDHAKPRSRTDEGYLDNLCRKLNQAFQIGEKAGVEAVVVLGDIFHRCDPLGACRNKALAVFQGDWDGRPWPFRILSLRGNHDVKNNPAYVPVSAFGTLMQAGVIEVPDSYDSRLDMGMIHHFPGVEHELENGLLSGDSAPVVYALHANIVKYPFYGSVLLDDIPTGDKTKLLVAGHIHKPMHYTRHDGLVYINPGSLARNSADTYNLERIPQVVQVDYKVDGSLLEIVYHPITQALPPSEVFHVAEIKARKEQKLTTSAYVQQIGRIPTLVRSKTAGVTQSESVRQSAIAKQVDQSVIDVVVAALREVEDSQEDLLRKKHS